MTSKRMNRKSFTSHPTLSAQGPCRKRHFVRSWFVTCSMMSILAVGCGSDPWPSPEPVDFEAFRSEHERWRSNRRDRMVRPPSGPVLWVGLWELPQGATAFGSDRELPIVLGEADSPPLAGTLHRTGQEVRLEPAAERVLSHGEEKSPVDEALLLGSDRSGDVTDLHLGSLGLRVHGEPGTERLWLRVWDEDLPVRDSFELPEYFPVDTAWRVAARFDPYPKPKRLQVWDVVSGTIEYETPGELVFRKHGREHRLIAVAGPESSSYFIMMWDSTAHRSTYQGGRYLRVPRAGDDGWTTIDFNRAYNAPCVFTAYSTCALPPRENRLDLEVSAGEQRPSNAAY